MGSERRCTTAPSGAGGSISARFSATVLPGHGEAVAVEEPCVEQLLHDHRHAAHPVEVDHVVVAVGFGVGDVRNPGRHLVEVVEDQVDAGLGGDGQEVQHGVGGTAEGHDDGDGVLEGLLRQDLTRPDVEAQQLHDRGARGAGVVVATTVDRRRGRRSGQRHSEGLAHRRHGVGREHAGAAADGRTGVALDGVELSLGDVAGGLGARPPRTPTRCRGPDRCGSPAGSIRRRRRPTGG